MVGKYRTVVHKINVNCYLTFKVRSKKKEKIHEDSFSPMNTYIQTETNNNWLNFQNKPLKKNHTTKKTNVEPNEQPLVLERKTTKYLQKTSPMTPKHPDRSRERSFPPCPSLAGHPM